MPLKGVLQRILRRIGVSLSILSKKDENRKKTDFQNLSYVCQGLGVSGYLSG